MNAINRLLTVVADWLLAPLAAWPQLALLVCAVIVGILMSLVFKYVSNQTALVDVLDRSRGHLLAIKLFKDDLPGMFRSLGNVVLLTCARLWYSIVPVFVMVAPLVFILAQLNLRFEFRPLASGEQAIVELQLNEESWDSGRGAKLEVNPVVAIESVALRDDQQRSIFWRIRALEPRVTKICWRLGDETIEKSVVIAADKGSLRQVSYRRPGTGWWDRTWHPGEPSFEEPSSVTAAIVHYPRRETPFFGLSIPWWVSFFVVSIVSALTVQPFLKVRF